MALLGIALVLIGFFFTGVKMMLLGIACILIQICRNQVAKYNADRFRNLFR